MASSSLLKAATADLLERTRSRRELAMSVLRGSVAIATLTAGFTFSTLLGQTFTPQHVFRAEQVELLLALTFLFSCMSVLFAGYVIIFVKVRQNAISLRLYLPKSDKRYQDAQIKAARLSTYELALSFAVMVVNSAAFVTMGLAIMAFQKVVGGLIVAVTAQTSLSLLLISCHLFL